MLAVLCCLAAAYTIWTLVDRLCLSPLRAIPGGLGYRLTALTSQVRALFGLLADDCERDYYAYGDIYAVGPRVVVVSHPDDCMRVLRTHHYAKNAFYQAFALVADNVYTTADGRLADLRRRQLRHVFASKQVHTHAVDCGLELVRRRWGEEHTRVVQMEHEFMQLAVCVMGVVAYGRGLSGRERRELSAWISDFNRLALVKLIVPMADRFPFSVLFRRLLSSKQAFAASVCTAIDGQCGRSTVVGALLSRERNPDALTRRQLVAEIMAVIIAGTDIVAQTLTWAIHYLMLYPPTYQRAIHEIRSRFPRNHHVTIDECLEHLPYVDAVLYECLRIRAATGVFLPRVVPPSGAVFQNRYLPAGIQLAVNVAGANHHQQTWPHSRQFMPERFIANPRDKSKVMSFSAGARLCPGRDLALHEMLVALANLLKNYDFALPESAKYNPDNLDAHGYPQAMPRVHRFTCVGPKYPDRDCQIIISPSNY
ncbi:hypothetical protein IWW55_000372 [Coemansia sp. RSA 2706]|nr:hypothetical protein IWW55_000372 [Coemansia sp. RSA 2706]KAJ2368353.1 hypothetical protein H4S01_001645 [Coemansia sp. RSA 2610]